MSLTKRSIFHISFVFRYRPALIECPISGSSKPARVSVGQGKQLPNVSQAMINVSYNSLLKPDTGEVLNAQGNESNLQQNKSEQHENHFQNKTRMNDKYDRNFTMCLSPIHDNPMSVENFVQYFELNKLLGAQKFIVYSFQVKLEGFLKVLKFYQRKGLVELVEWKLPNKTIGKVWYFAQIAMLNDCLQRNKGVSKYIINTDLDEFIVPVNSANWDELLNKERNACEYNIKSVGLKGTLCKPGVLDDGSVCTTTIERPIISNFIFSHRVRSKYILRTSCQSIARIHFNQFSKEFKQKAKDSVINNVDDKNAIVLHYGSIKKLFGNKGGIQTNILDRFRTQLQDNIVSVIKAAGLYKR